MIGYVTLGASDKARATAFYDGLLPLLGAKQVFSNDHLVFWGNGPGKPMLAVGTPYDKNPATAGNGTMIALSASDTAMVDALYAKALELGGTCEGKPGKRMDNFYGAYFRDTEGNKLAAFCMV